MTCATAPTLECVYPFVFLYDVRFGLFAHLVSAWIFFCLYIYIFNSCLSFLILWKSKN